MSERSARVGGREKEDTLGGGRERRGDGASGRGRCPPHFRQTFADVS